MNTNKKTEKPKRPLSAYNLFYRYKRILILKVSNDDTEFITKLMTTPPGLEGFFGDGIHNVSSDQWTFVQNDLVGDRPGC